MLGPRTARDVPALKIWQRSARQARRPQSRHSSESTGAGARPADQAHVPLAWMPYEDHAARDPRSVAARRRVQHRCDRRRTVATGSREEKRNQQQRGGGGVAAPKGAPCQPSCRMCKCVSCWNHFSRGRIFHPLSAPLHAVETTKLFFFSSTFKQLSCRSQNRPTLHLLRR